MTEKIKHPALPSLEDLAAIADMDVGDFDEYLRKHATLSLTPDEIKAQRLSFVMGMLPRNFTLTRDEVAKLLADYYG